MELTLGISESAHQDISCGSAAMQNIKVLDDYTMAVHDIVSFLSLKFKIELE